MTVEDIDRVPWFRLTEVIGEEIVGGRVLVTALVENSHGLLRLGRDIWNAVVAPGSSIGVSGANIMCATPAGCSAMVKGFQSWNPNGRSPWSASPSRKAVISPTDRASDACLLDGVEVGLLRTPKKMHAGRRGHRNRGLKSHD